VDRLERLVNLVAALIDTDRPLTRADIAERIDGYSSDPSAFRRNFERDKELLRQMGFPVVTEIPEGPSEEIGYRIPRELYELPDPGLDEEELTAIRLAATAVHLEGDWSEALVAALRKLGGAVGTANTDGDGPLPAGELRVEASAAAAFAAIAERRRRSLSYSGKPRRVEPWRLAYHRGNWYMSGFDLGPGAERLFRLDRVGSDLAGYGDPGAFEIPAAAQAGPAPPWLLGDEEPRTALVLVDADNAPAARAELGASAVKEARPDGSLLFELTFTSTPGLRTAVLGYLDHAEVLAPADLRAHIVDWLERLA
jgi:proteasome accessory factor B